MNEPGCYRVSLERYPGMNRFVLDWLGGDERFLPRRENRQARLPVPDLINALIASNKQWGLDVAPDLRAWAAGETQTIVAGQQTGFAGGPLYTIAKIASLLKMKREKPSTIFFWLATEDHDFAEVATLAIPNRDEHRQRDLIYLRATNGDSRKVVGSLPIPESLVQQLMSALGIASRPKWLRPGITFRDSFAELVAESLGGGFILIDALLPELRRAGAPLFDAIKTKWNEVQSAIGRRSEEMARAGYTP
ncbi:MAG TPA: bacillithiol biosynthesis BshC, partial [Thermoanaerobaculia bacterium]|nr:bacillithiol biosynthesis BshC [Thermoanaerobaculia bacterium]